MPRDPQPITGQRRTGFTLGDFGDDTDAEHSCARGLVRQRSIGVIF